MCECVAHCENYATHFGLYCCNKRQKIVYNHSLEAEGARQPHCECINSCFGLLKHWVFRRMHVHGYLHSAQYCKTKSPRLGNFG